jgi:hypothetical protein
MVNLSIINSNFFLQNQEENKKEDLNKKEENYSELSAYAKFHFNDFKNEIESLTIIKKRKKTVNLLFLFLAIILMLLFFKSKIIKIEYTLGLSLFCFVIFKYIKIYDNYLSVIFKDKSNAEYLIYNNEKEAAVNLINNFKNNI